MTLAGAGRRAADRWPTAVVLVVTGLAGGFLGAVRGPSWQDALEPAQVLAGLVAYPPDNPVYLYSTRAWTILHQGPALLLAAGVTERTLAWLLSGAMGVASFQALGLVTLALGGRPALAAAAPFFVFTVLPAGDGVGYPVFFFGVPFTYGVFGLALFVYVIGLLANGHLRAGAVLLGLLPAVHPALGVWCAGIAGLALLADLRTWRPHLSRLLGWAAVGAGASGASLLVHYASQSPVPPVDPAEAARHYRAMLDNWDVHRRAVGWTADLLLMNYTTVLLAVVAWWRLRSVLPRPALFLLTALATATGLAAAGTLFVERWPDLTPVALSAAMPSRLFNVSVFAGLAALVGLLGRFPASLWCAGVLASLVVLLSWTRPGEPPALVDPFGTMRAAAMLLAGWVIIRGGRTPDTPGRPARALGAAAIAAPAVLFAWTAADSAARYDRTVGAALADRTTDAFFGVVGARPGLLLTSSHLHRMQLVTRRPVLFDGGAIDALAYVPQAGPSAERIVRDVYGLSLFEPQWPAGRREAYLPDEAGRALWEARSLEDWQAIRRRFGVTDVLTWHEWTLQLPRLRSAHGLALWWIPG